MKKVIYKYMVSINEKQFISLPKGAEILSVQIQKGEPCLWTLIDESQPLEQRCFEVNGTGQPINYDVGVERKFIATFQKDWFVGHLFELIS